MYIVDKSSKMYIVKGNRNRPRNAGESEEEKMRITKKMVYAKYDIEMKGDKILSPIGWITELLKEGNDKTGKRVYTWSILPGRKEYVLEVAGEKIVICGTCICNCDGCYAMRKRYNTPSVKESMARNTYLVNEHIDFVRRAISAQLEYIGRGEVRIHAAGDFNTKAGRKYPEMWRGIAEKFNSFRFWTYTKIHEYESLFDGLKNANIVKSVIPGIGINFGHCDYIISAYYTLREAGKRVYICRCGIDKNQHCERCGICATYDYVLFLEHSTEYIAEKDPLYPALVEIVNAQ